MRPRSIRACSTVNAMVLLPELGSPVSQMSAPFCSSRSSRCLRATWPSCQTMLVAVSRDPEGFFIVVMLLVV